MTRPRPAAQGEAGVPLAFVLEGRVCCDRGPRDPRPGWQVTVGALVGGDEALAWGARSVRCTALGFVTLLALPRNHLATLLDAWPEVGHRAAARAAARRAARGLAPEGAPTQRPRLTSVLDCSTPAIVAQTRGLVPPPPPGSRAAALLAAAAPPARGGRTPARTPARPPAPAPAQLALSPSEAPRPAPAPHSAAVGAPAEEDPLAGADWGGFSARLAELLAMQGAHTAEAARRMAAAEGVQRRMAHTSARLVA